MIEFCTSNAAMYSMICIPFCTSQVKVQMIASLFVCSVLLHARYEPSFNVVLRPMVSPMGIGGVAPLLGSYGALMAFELLSRPSNPKSRVRIPFSKKSST
jgi:hypothetical protein